MEVNWKRAARWYATKLRGTIGRVLGYREDGWMRVVQIDEWKDFLSRLPLKNMAALEISPGMVSHWRNIGFGSYETVQYPEFDITEQVLPRSFDIIIAEQVFEHLSRPYEAARNIHRMLKSDGLFLIATPFLIRIHAHPADYTRWTPQGLERFLRECGFDPEVHSWGNRKCVVANLKKWTKYGWWRDLRNEPNFPLNVWAYARKNSN